MAKINVLDISVANLIAAGEVVERPASVVKELLENSVDAGASQITVEIKRGGISFIRVADNGSGIPRGDVPLSLKRHATSKINEASDLTSIMTLGFRGEALAAISSVARVRIITRTSDEHIGTMLESEPDGEVGVSDTGAPQGTTVIVEELFANVPARLKFLKKDTGEAMAVTAIVEKLALSRPDIALRYIIDGARKMDTAGTGKLEDAIYAVLGRDFAKRLIPVDEMTEGVAVTGFIGTPESARGNRNYENFFANGRYIKSLTASTAAEQAFESYIPGDKFPACVLNIAIHPSLVDVNVHPTKLEVKFSNERIIFEAVYCAVRNALATKLRHLKLDAQSVKLTGDDLGAISETITSQLDANERDGDITKSEPSHDSCEATPENNNTATAASPAASSLLPDAAKPAASLNLNIEGIGGKPAADDTVSSRQSIQPSDAARRDFSFDCARDFSESHIEQNASPDNLPLDYTIPLKADKQSSIILPDKGKITENGGLCACSSKPADSETPFRIAGILFNCFIIVESGDSVYIIDKHAAHERVLFEDMKKRMQNESGDAQSQLLFIPIELMLSANERGAVDEFSDEFSSLGYAFTDLDGSKLGLIQIPSDLSADAAGELFAALCSALAERSGSPRSERNAIYEHALYTASCKAAMKAGRDDGGSASLSWLVRRVLTDSAVRVCPHGRPVAVWADKAWFDKLFGRI